MERIKVQANAEIEGISDQELFIAGVVAYWAEGSKEKAWKPGATVTFTNSDPGLITLFLRWLELIGIQEDRVVFRLMIHETASIENAVLFWANHVGVRPEEFQPTTLKKHTPITVRKNVGASYNGCLTVRVRRSTNLCRQIDGWCGGILARLTIAPAREPFARIKLVP